MMWPCARLWRNSWNRIAQSSVLSETGWHGSKPARALEPDVIIADTSMPVLNGVQAVRQLMSAQPDARVIFLTVHTVHEDPTFVMEGGKAGALGYVLKRNIADRLMPSIREVLQGNPFIRPALLSDPAFPANLSGRHQRFVAETRKTPSRQGASPQIGYR
jgi:DNA-binding NarL/FixJ family response regulator